MTTAEFDAERLEELRERFSGPLLSSADEGYDDARRVHNGLIDRRPALIARCHGTADIVGCASRSLARKGWRSRFAAAGTTSPAGLSSTAGS